MEINEVMLGKASLPFPFAAGENITAKVNGQRKYFKITEQPAVYDFAFPYMLTAAGELPNQTITTGQGQGSQPVFRTIANEMKEWVAWIDNAYLGVQWEINDHNYNAILGITFPLTKYTSPFGSKAFPLFAVDNISGNVTFTLTNLSQLRPIAGTLHIEMYDYSLEPIEKPSSYINIQVK